MTEEEWTPIESWKSREAFDSLMDDRSLGCCLVGPFLFVGLLAVFLELISK